MALLEIKDLVVNFNTYEGTVQALEGVDFYLEQGETVGLVGESGCGKSVTAMMVLRLIPMPPGEVVKGEILYQGKNLLNKSLKEMRSIRGKEISMIFQEPMSSLNPVFHIEDQLISVIRLHQELPLGEAREKAVDMLKLVNIPDPEEVLKKYPFELSGGMCQRVLIAMVLSCKPNILIADEPTTALDVTIQYQILELMKELQDKIGTTTLLITHDLGVVAEMCKRVAVMYAGRIIEEGSVEQIIEDPRHPYTVGLIDTIPRLWSENKWLSIIPGSVPNLLHPPPGCRFHPRCSYATEECKKKKPAPAVIEDGHRVFCYHLDQVRR